MNTPRVIRLNGEDNVVIAIDLVNQGDPAHGLTARQRIHKGHKMAIEPIREGEPVRKFNQIIGFATRTSRPATRAHAQCSACTTSSATTRFAEDAHDDGLLPPRQRATFEGYRRAERPRRHAQLHRRPDQRELLGIGARASPRRRSSARAPRRLPRTSTASSRSCTAPAAAMAAYGEGFEVLRAHAVGLRQPPQLRRRRHGRPRLRGVPDRAA